MSGTMLGCASFILPRSAEVAMEKTLCPLLVGSLKINKLLTGLHRRASTSATQQHSLLELPRALQQLLHLLAAAVSRRIVQACPLLAASAEA
jgi:hypothetical protein